MRRSVSPDLRDAGSNHFLRRNVQWCGGTLGEMDYLRGWKDDFLGDSIDVRYNEITNGVGSFIALLDDVHGGAVTLTSGAGAGRYARLYLGLQGGGFDTLDADNGWTQIARIRPSATTSVIWWMGAIITPALNRYILWGVNTTVNANYTTSCNDGAGSSTDSGVASDTDWHIHRMDVYPITGGRQVDCWVDGTLLVSHTTNMPTEPLTGYLTCYSVGDALRDIDVDYWIVLPRELA